MPEKPVVQVGEGERTRGSLGRAPDQQHTGIYTSDNPEFHYYTKLLEGFFAKLNRWQGILDEYGEGGVWRGFRVSGSEENPIILPSTLPIGDRAPDTILNVAASAEATMPGLGQLNAKFHVWTGAAGRHLLTDPEDGEPLDEVEIEVSDKDGITYRWQELGVRAHRPRIWRNAEYEFFREGDITTLTVNRYPSHAIPDEMATNLLDTIDSLIPTTTSQTPQAEQSTAPEVPPTPPAHPLRRPAG